MSPGLVAVPLGMFSVAGTTTMTRMGSCSSAMARSAAMTVAPPAMSSFIRSMPSAGLIEMPPVSKVMPFPTSAEDRRRRRAFAARTAPPASAAARRFLARRRGTAPCRALRADARRGSPSVTSGKRQKRLAACNELSRRQPIAGFVDEHARGVGRFADARAPLDCGRARRALPATSIWRDEEPSFVLALVVAVVVVAEHGALDERLESRVADRPSGDDDGDTLAPLLPRQSWSRSRRCAGRARRRTRSLARTHEQHAACCASPAVCVVHISHSLPLNSPRPNAPSARRRSPG